MRPANPHEEPTTLRPSTSRAAGHSVGATLISVYAHCCRCSGQKMARSATAAVDARHGRNRWYYGPRFESEEAGSERQSLTHNSPRPRRPIAMPIARMNPPPRWGRLHFNGNASPRAPVPRHESSPLGAAGTWVNPDHHIGGLDDGIGCLAHRELQFIDGFVGNRRGYDGAADIYLDVRRSCP